MDTPLSFRKTRVPSTRNQWGILYHFDCQLEGLACAWSHLWGRCLHSQMQCRILQGLSLTCSAIGSWLPSWVFLGQCRLCLCSWRWFGVKHSWSNLEMLLSQLHRWIHRLTVRGYLSGIDMWRRSHKCSHHPCRSQMKSHQCRSDLSGVSLGHWLSIQVHSQRC